MRSLIVCVLVVVATGAGAVTVPYVRIDGIASGLANTCAASATPASVLVDMNVPAGASYQYSIFFLITPTSAIDQAAAGKAGSPQGIEPPPQGPADPYYALLYTSASVRGPAAGSSMPFNLAAPSAWYAGSVQSIPDHTQALVQISTYASTSAGSAAVATAAIAWDCSSGALDGLSNDGNAAGTPAAAMAVEYYNASLDHYFVTVDATEIVALDTGRFTGWARTGLGFNVFADGSGGASPVCRFYIPPGLGDSHFYSASPAECDKVRAQFPAFDYESPNVFYVGLPDSASGACTSGTLPVYRLWNQRADSNHRYTVDRAIKAQMIARGYIAEGYGPDAVAMCASP